VTDGPDDGRPLAPGARSTLPVGTVTFLRTDVEGSMELARRLGPRWDATNGDHLRRITDAVLHRGGRIVRTEGDAVFAAFAEAGAAVAAAIDAQRALADHPWPDDALVRVRMGLHTGEAHLAGADYGGFEVNRAARVAAVGHGGQILLSGPTFELVADALPAGTSARELGRFVLKGVPRPERLVQLDVAGLPVDFPPVRAGRATTGNLDRRLTSFLGRDRELSDLVGLLSRSRLVTLTGPGGIGKSSLATELARAVEADYPDGAWFVPLETVERAADMPGLIARTIGLYDGPTRSAVEALPTFLAERSMLLVLDNFEHVMEAATGIPTLLRGASGLRVIGTSRAPLHLTGEQEYPVPPLGRTDPDAAIRLFVDRARAVLPGWEPGTDGATIGEICALLDGLPLGVELAAARVSLLPLPAIRDRLRAHLPLPGSGPRDAPARQRTLDGAVAWSHDLLDTRLQRILHQLAVFDGGFAEEQAAQVATEGANDQAQLRMLDDLAMLVDQSLIERDPSRPEPRFRLLETVRSFAATRLEAEGGTAATRRRHATAYLALAHEARRHMSTIRQASWVDRLAADEPNLRSAVRWAIDAGETDLALRLVASLWRFWQADGHLSEGRELATRALAMPGAEVPTEARMWALGAAGSLAYWQADMAHTRTLYQAQLDLARALDDARGIADAMFNLAHVEFLDAKDFVAGKAILDEVRQRFLDLGDEVGVARVDWAIGNGMLEAGDPSVAAAIFRASRERFAALGDAQYQHMAAASVAWAEFRLGHEAEATRWAIIGLRESYATHDVGTTSISLHIGVLVAMLVGDADAATRLSGAFDAACERYGVRPPAALDRFLKTSDPFRLAREAMAPEAWDLAYSAGRRMMLGEAVDLATSLASPDPGEAPSTAGPASKPRV
jgi:predicted ATPase/class 3 adenylate cyclase